MDVFKDLLDRYTVPTALVLALLLAFVVAFGTKLGERLAGAVWSGLCQLAGWVSDRTFDVTCWVNRNLLGMNVSHAEQLHDGHPLTAVEQRSPSNALAVVRQAHVDIVSYWTGSGYWAQPRFRTAVRLWYAALVSAVYGVMLALAVPASVGTAATVELMAFAGLVSAIAVGHHDQPRLAIVVPAAILAAGASWMVWLTSGWNGWLGRLVDGVAAAIVSAAALAAVGATRRSSGPRWLTVHALSSMAVVVYGLVNIVNALRLRHEPWWRFAAVVGITGACCVLAIVLVVAASRRAHRERDQLGRSTDGRNLG